MREYITSHPKYAKDSVVSEEITYDLAKAVDEV
jgi:glutamate--cysteine ligase catalytic subunit